MQLTSAEVTIPASRSKNYLQFSSPEAGTPIPLSLSFTILIVLHSVRTSPSTFNMYLFVSQAFACRGSVSFCSVEDTACLSTQSRLLCSLAAPTVRGAPSTEWSIQSLNCDAHQLLSITRLRLSARTASRGRLHRFNHSSGKHQHRIKRNLFRPSRLSRPQKHFESRHDVPRASTVAPSPNMHQLPNRGETKNT